jgi:drug/metabolite transporter (DMT)-like permease
MSGRTDSDTDAESVIAEPEDPADQISDARRARWIASGTGVLLTLAGLAAALLRLTGSAAALVSAAYALGAAVCALAAVLGFRGRTRRALWLLIVGTMIMAFGDQFD